MVEVFAEEGVGLGGGEALVGAVGFAWFNLVAVANVAALVDVECLVVLDDGHGAVEG